MHLNRKIFRVSNIEYKSCIKACISCVELIQVNGFLKSLFSSSTDFPCILSENWFENICSVRLFVSYSVAPLGFHILALLKLIFFLPIFYQTSTIFPIQYYWISNGPRIPKNPLNLFQQRNCYEKKWLLG